jgi:hypothetical protein
VLNINQMHISNPANTINHLLQQQQQQQQQQGMFPSNNIPTGAGLLPSSSAAASSSSSRPKSAGALGRGGISGSRPQTYDNGGAGGGSSSSNSPYVSQQQQGQQPLYQQQQQQQQQYPFPSSALPSSSNRPLSANATSHTTSYNNISNSNSNGGAGAAATSIDWNNPSYKLQYGNNILKQQQQQQQQPPVTSIPQQVSYGDQKQQPQQQPQQRPVSSSAASKLRNALDLSHKLEGGGNNQQYQVPISELAGFDNDGGVDGGEGDGDDFGVEGDGTVGISAKRGTGGAMVTVDDDEEMDGKPVMNGQDSRSHPEISMTTPSASLELANSSSLAMANGGSSTLMDARNTSLDSFSEDNVNIGLSTVPNQFCSKRDAVELKKLLVLSQGTRGGIVPSSSAVMDMYMVGKVIGVGSYGKVRAAWHRLTGNFVPSCSSMV